MPSPTNLNDLAKPSNLPCAQKNFPAPTSEVFTSLNMLSELEELDLSDCQITGFFTEDWSNLRHLTTLNLSGNNLEGPIPADLSALGFLRHLNLDYNANLYGFFPSHPELLPILQKRCIQSNPCQFSFKSTQITQFLPVTFTPHIIMAVSSPSRFHVFQRRQADNTTSNSSSSDNTVIYILVAIVAIIIMVIGAGIYFCLKRRRETRRDDSRSMDSIAAYTREDDEFYFEDYADRQRGRKNVNTARLNSVVNNRRNFDGGNGYASQTARTDRESVYSVDAGNDNDFEPVRRKESSNSGNRSRGLEDREKSNNNRADRSRDNRSRSEGGGSRSRDMRSPNSEQKKRLDSNSRSRKSQDGNEFREKQRTDVIYPQRTGWSNDSRSNDSRRKNEMRDASVERASRNGKMRGDLEDSSNRRNNNETNDYEGDSDAFEKSRPRKARSSSIGTTSRIRNQIDAENTTVSPSRGIVKSIRMNDRAEPVYSSDEEERMVSNRTKNNNIRAKGLSSSRGKVRALSADTSDAEEIGKTKRSSKNRGRQGLSEQSKSRPEKRSDSKDSRKRNSSIENSRPKFQEDSDNENAVMNTRNGSTNSRTQISLKNSGNRANKGKDDDFPDKSGKESRPKVFNPSQKNQEIFSSTSNNDELFRHDFRSKGTENSKKYSTNSRKPEEHNCDEETVISPTRAPAKLKKSDRTKVPSDRKDNDGIQNNSETPRSPVIIKNQTMNSSDEEDFNQNKKTIQSNSKKTHGSSNGCNGSQSAPKDKEKSDVDIISPKKHRTDSKKGMNAK
ncbi:hypothetical protein HK100_000891 [Physocladia obscura]|uniref:Uncharacterized protein n=1 Tax=Physocladia obscura TaxID=109957 RepID=A0AAD5SZF3_9FUNG|nr:hypothetical protein HK100_000891 [Physocladia obscura]